MSQAEFDEGKGGKLADRVQALIEPAIEGEGYELLEATFITERGRAILRLFIDTIPPSDAERGVSVEDCTNVSRLVGDLLDIEDTVGGQYHLEVSSPGLFRPLTKPAHFERVIGQRVKVKTFQKIGERRVFIGRLVGLQEGRIQVEVDGQLHELDSRDVAKANLEPELGF